MHSSEQCKHSSELSLHSSELSLHSSELSLHCSEVCLHCSELSSHCSELSLDTSELSSYPSEVCLHSSEEWLYPSALSSFLIYLKERTLLKLRSFSKVNIHKILNYLPSSRVSGSILTLILNTNEPKYQMQCGLLDMQCKCKDLHCIYNYRVPTSFY
jgi:hypothetical protein